MTKVEGKSSDKGVTITDLSAEVELIKGEKGLVVNYSKNPNL